MPLLKFITNVPDKHMPSDFDMKLSSKLAECLTHWTEEHVTVLVLTGQKVIRCRDEAPNAIIEIYCCSEFNDNEKNRNTSRILIDLANSELGISKDRMTVCLHRIENNHCGLANGTLVSDLM